MEIVVDLIKEHISLFKNAGFEVGVWIWTFMIVGDTKYEHITSPNGKISANQICPSDENFRKFAAEYVKDIAKLSPDIIMFLKERHI
ncbi:MAG: hypothetical protein IJ800_06870 [Clostridia bacterium]|nr:hypothetical protein [Clostridia bacterium]